MADEDMWRPPVNRLMRSLDRAFFQRTVELKAARVFDNKNISPVRTALERSRDVLSRERLSSVHPDPHEPGKKSILLRPEVRTTDRSACVESSAERSLASSSPWPHSPTLHELASQGLVAIIPFHLKLDYNFWTYHEIISAILPEDEQGEIPSGFSQVGHVAHVNLRDEYLKYKCIIAEILMDKNPGVQTVINKVDDVGEESEYRTFKYEVLAGADDLNVSVSEENCTFHFDYSKVYWNSRLSTEHRRLVSTFDEGEAVCDVMAGIGPFAVPAGKKKIFVWANDLNPESFNSMQDAISRNKVQDYVKPFNEDGRKFIRKAVAELAKAEHHVDVVKRPARKVPRGQAEVVKTLHQPRTFQHFVMNLPATAITFLPCFIGLYPPDVRDTLPADIKMPLIHVYCFSTKSDDNVQEGIKICEEITKQLQHHMTPGKIEEKGKVEIHDVRDVAPKKRMFCATFRLPEEVAFRDVSTVT